MKPVKTEDIERTGGDLVLQETWLTKDKLSAACGHSMDRLFAEARKCQKQSGDPFVNLQTQRPKA